MRANLSLFTRPLFLLGLVLLIANDFYLKYAFPGIVSGKLSDFAGLFIFPYFFSVFFEKRTKIVYVATALYFTFWKLEISQPYIDWLSSLTHLPVYRTVDVTDLIALLILPVSYQYFRKELVLPVKGNLAIQMTVILISAFSFVATKLPEDVPVINIKSGKAYMIPVSKEQLQKEFSDLISSNTFYDSFYLNGYETTIYVKLEVKEYDKNNSIIILEEILDYSIKGNPSREKEEEITKKLNRLTRKDFEKHFKAHLTQKYGSARTLKSGLSTQ
ncbi:hypothetical protein NAT51_17780 [Flavobacterium amniphilum]|uniref:hypothetical protein n=1 Tax=Flavobacterium amniphilum TaxID=1834035 RepID=UPI00202A817E|nr:hypothetical protein [Flavobacterium amniphilum]MCL9807382.1 hypothetical protein [Flavobacterium amniphilum]